MIGRDKGQGAVRTASRRSQSICFSHQIHHGNGSPLLAAHDYLLTGSVAGGQLAGLGVGCSQPGDLWQVSSARFPDGSSALEFVWVTVTGGVCCDKRLMWGAPGSCLDTGRVGGRGAGLPPATAPRSRLADPPAAPAVGSSAPLSQTPFIPASLCTWGQLLGSASICLWAEPWSCCPALGDQG